MIAKGMTLADLASRLGPQLHHPVIDKTGLAGSYDLTLEYAAGLASDAGSNIVYAVEKQLGLKLTAGKAKLDVIVVDHANKVPTEN